MPQTQPKKLCCTPESAWHWVALYTADALEGHASPRLVANVVAHWFWIVSEAGE